MQLLNSQTKMSKIGRFTVKNLRYIVWALRILIGATFIISGVSKLIDLWGFIYKIEQYLSVWDFVAPRSIVFMVALGLSAYEFVIGMLLAIGSYRRVSVYALLLMMGGMLPLSAYILLADPVDDCGCFGDFLIISNAATFVKNLILVGALIYLVKFNHKIKGLCHRYSQWIQIMVLIFYALTISLIGYNTQPLIDFRSHKVGTSLIETGSNDEILFVYSKNGKEEVFSVNDLPDSSWTFVERIEPNVTEKKQSLAITDGEEDITEEVLWENGEQLLLLIPEVDRADISYTYFINEINQYVASRGGEMIGLLATNQHGIEYWRDISMADYPIYSVEDTEVKELARGNIALVYLKDGKIQWKRTLSSVDDQLFDDSNKGDAFASLYINGTLEFWSITGAYLGILCILLLIDKFVVRLRRRICRKNGKKNVTLHSENNE